jgi:hypothetical protein
MPHHNKIEKLVPLSFEEAVDQILDDVTDKTAMPAPEWINKLPPISKTLKKKTMVQKKSPRKLEKSKCLNLKSCGLKKC